MRDLLKAHPMVRLFALGIPAFVVYGSLGSLVSVLAHLTPPSARSGVAGLGFGLAALVCVALYRWVVGALETRPVSELPLPPGRDLAAGIGLGALLICGAQAVALLTGASRIAGFAWSWHLLLPLMLSVFAAVGEEIVFRGFIYRSLRDAAGIPAAVTVSALIFGALHLLNKAATLTSALAIAVEAGLLLSLAYELRNSLWLPIGIHFGWNFVEGGIIGSAVSGTHADSLFRIASAGPERWTGGAFGLEASLQAVILDAAAGVGFAIAIRSARRSP